MPLPKRSIEPVHVARSTYVHDPNAAPDELETVTNITLTNIIRQLSSLSKHSEDLFGELSYEATNLAERANSLQARIDRLAVKVTQLDSTIEEVNLHDIQLKKAFKSASNFDQQIFSRATMPAPMLETYNLCDKPPPLDKLNCYRDDGKDGLKFYTDPNYFFELWRQEMLKDTERMMHDRGKKMHRPRSDAVGGQAGQRQKKRPRTPHNTREKQRQIAIGHGETLMPNNVNYRTPSSLINSEDSAYGTYESRPPRPNSIELRRSYPPEMVDGYGQLQTGQMYGQSEYGHPQQQQMMQQGQMYDDQGMYNQHGIYGPGQGPLSSDSLYAPGTPSRTKPRPSQPPPAPPGGGSGGATPNASNAGTPTRGRSVSSGRDNLPPPPPVPEGNMSPPHMMQMNGGTNSMAAKLLARSHSNSRSGSPQLIPHGGHMDHNAMNMAQLNSQINNLNAINLQMSQLNTGNDLPPPPPIPEQMSAKVMPHAAPPPPPPPPPDGLQSPPTANKIIPNGNANGNIMTGAQPQNIIAPQKKIIPQYHDSRNDLMKAIRDGIKLRKVEKIEQNKDERPTALHDVASILARRVAIELSTDSESTDSEDSEGWVEPTNETSA